MPSGLNNRTTNFTKIKTAREQGYCCSKTINSVLLVNKCNFIQADVP